MNKIILALSFIISMGMTNMSFERVSGKRYSKLPLFIAYVKKQPPDSIQDFMKIYLTTKQIEVITWKGVMELFQNEIQVEMMSLVTSGKINNITEAKASQFSNSLRPVSNILAMNIFTDTLNQSNYIIDSIEWYIGSMPVKDTNQVKIKFYPGNENKANPYFVLRSFSDWVVSSGLLK